MALLAQGQRCESGYGNGPLDGTMNQLQRSGDDQIVIHITSHFPRRQIQYYTM
jgi:hypothetical protein